MSVCVEFIKRKAVAKVQVMTNVDPWPQDADSKASLQAATEIVGKNEKKKKRVSSPFQGGYEGL